MKTINRILPFCALFLLMSCNTYDKNLEILDIDQKWKDGNLTEAKVEVNKYLIKRPDNELAWTLLGHIEADQNQDSLAEVAYNKALEINPKTVEAITGMGIISRIRGDYDKAAQYYYNAIDIDPNYAEAYSSLVVINLKRGEFRKAVKAGLKSYELDKNNGTIAANLSVAYHYTNDTINREKYFNIAKRNGYKSTAALRQIFSGELTVLDE